MRACYTSGMDDDKLKEVASAAEHMIQVLHGEPFRGDVAAALRYIAEAAERCWDDTEWFFSEVRGELIRLHHGH